MSCSPGSACSNVNSVRVCRQITAEITISISLNSLHSAKVVQRGWQANLQPNPTAKRRLPAVLLLPADAAFEELFVRIVPVEVCCIHSNSSNGGTKAPQKSGSQCLRMQGASAGRHGHFPDAASLMPGTPTGGSPLNPLNPTAVGLYPTLSSTEMGTCFCPNCCSNSYTESAAINSNAERPAAAGAAADSAEAPPLTTVAVQRLTVRVLGQKARYGANGRLLPGCYRLELSSDSSLFFLFLSTITEAAFQEIKVRACFGVYFPGGFTWLCQG